MRLRAALAHSRESGFTLVELLIAMLVFGILLTMVVGFFSTSNKAYVENQSIGGNTRSASDGMNEISRFLRAATTNPVIGQQINSPAFVAASNESVTFYAYVNLTSATEQPVEVRFSLDSNRNLVETEWASYLISPGYWGYSTTPSSSRILANSVAPQSGSNPYLFTYLAPDGTTIAIPTGGYTTAQLATIASVQVTLTIGKSVTSTTAVTLQNTVGLPNLAIARTA
jgi:prepilin-type N-terminal cleavage/methylation domain-containing protein